MFPAAAFFDVARWLLRSCTGHKHIAHLHCVLMPCMSSSVYVFRNLLRMAISLRAVTQNTTLVGPTETEDRGPSAISAWCYPFKERASSDRPAVAMEDILSLPVHTLHLDEPIAEGPQNQKPISVGVQTEHKDFCPDLFHFFYAKKSIVVQINQDYKKVEFCIYKCHRVTAS
eukprot:Gb_09951 [translate_table: standard]